MSRRRRSSDERIEKIADRENNKRKSQVNVHEREHISIDENAERSRHTHIERIPVKKERCDTGERPYYSNRIERKDVMSESCSGKSKKKHQQNLTDSDDDSRAVHSHKIKIENDSDEYSGKRQMSKNRSHFNRSTDRDGHRERRGESRHSKQENGHCEKGKEKRSSSRGENGERTRRQHWGNGSDDGDVRPHGETSRWREHSGSDDERGNRNRRGRVDPEGPNKKKRRGDSEPEREERLSKHLRHNDEHPKCDWGKPTDEEKECKKPVEKEKPNFEKSGKLTEHTNTYCGVVIKYNEPKEARKPKRRWRLHPYKGDEELKIIHLHRQSAYLIGRNRKIAEIPLDHPSISQQHAVLQYRSVPYENLGGRKGRRVWPYIIDIGSSNGTFINNEKIEPQRYVELQEQDVLKFGFSTREYVILHEDSANGIDFSDDENEKAESKEKEEE